MPAKSKSTTAPKLSTKSTPAPATKSISKVSKSKAPKHPPGSMLSRWDMDAALKKTKKRKANAKFLASGNAWRAHVKETMRKNPNMKLKPLLKLASKTYKKGSTSNNSGAVNIKTSRYSVQVRPKVKKTKRAKKRTSRKKRTGLFGF